MDDFINILTLVLNWPVILGGLVLFILLKFKSELRTYVFSRVTEIQYKDLIIKFSKQVVEQKEEALKAKEISEKIGVEEIIRIEDKVEVIKFEVIWEKIFRSQIELLEHLSKNDDKLTNLRTFYNEFLARLEKRLPSIKTVYEDRFSFNEYIGFLFANKLIEVKEYNRLESIITITSLGRNFLNYARELDYKNIKFL
jgi:hypothetical protein